MRNLLKREDGKCGRLRDALEEAAANHADPLRLEGLIERLRPMEREHIHSCERCRESARDLVATKELFRGAARLGEEERPWFAARVMAAIASRERQLAERVSAWSEFPRFASRLSWVAAIVILASTTWFYERVVRTPAQDSNGAQESIFEAPQQTTPDDVLVSRAGDNP